MDLAETEGTDQINPLTGVPSSPVEREHSVTLTAQEADSLARNVLDQIARIEFDERYRHHDVGAFKLKLWLTIKKLVLADLILPVWATTRLADARSGIRVLPSLFDLEDAPLKLLLEMTYSHEACTLGYQGGTALYVSHVARKRLGSAVRALAARDECQDLTVAELAGAYFHKWMTGEVPNLTFPTSDELLAELLQWLGRDVAYSEDLDLFPGIDPLPPGPSRVLNPRCRYHVVEWVAECRPGER